jgi:hypothetical protein
MNFKEYHGYKVYDNGTVIGKRLGKPLKLSTTNRGYLHFIMYIDGKQTNVRVHRLVAKLFLPNFYGKPTVDHIDRNRSNNSLYNLRWSTQSEQCHNTKIRSSNTSGVKGVIYRKRDDNWCAQITINGKLTQKYFKTKELAIIQRKEWELDLFSKYKV